MGLTYELRNRKYIQFIDEMVPTQPSNRIERASSDIKCATNSSIVEQDSHHSNLTMKPMDFARRKGVLGDKGLPSVRKWSKFEHGLKRTKRIYLHGSNNDIISRPMPPPKEHPGELPGIGAKQQRIKCGTICVHDNKVLCASSRSKTILESGTASSGSHDFYSGRETVIRIAGGESPFGVNSISSSATGSGSWTSGNGSTTSPRRRIRVPTPIASSPGSTENGEHSKITPMHRSPRPPSDPRKVYQKSRSKRKDTITLGNDGYGIRNDKGADEGNDDQGTTNRPKTPALGNSRHFKATLQNIQEFCPRPDSSESDSYEKMKMKRVSKASSRRRSVGTLLNSRVDGDDEAPVLTRNGRRLSMPVDLHELKEQIGGIRFINVREFSREYIQNILSHRDKEATKGIAGDKRRQNKCLSWLQSLEGAL